ncbi:hypothetical protein AB0L65_32850 [Nonomuraea sp. NPDC052116]|uniref:hypothetical protein n=1 Tax=Nonomuraea sp. NPDC052116 TaxID=3155665 RepID=UPI00343DD750
MTPQELYAAVDTRRQALKLPWWRVAIQLDISAERIRLMRKGQVSAGLRSRVEAWLGETA